MPTFSGQLRSHLSPLLPPRQRPLQSPPGRSARRQRGASVALLSPPPAAAAGEPELSVAQTSPAGPSPRVPRTLSNPLGSRRLLREETLAAAGAGAARLRAGRRRCARYGEPGNEARAGAQRRRVLAEHDRGAAAAVAVAAGAQGPLHHWQPWSPSIFLPRGRRSARRASSGRKGRRPSLPRGRRDVRGSRGCAPLQPLPPRPACLRPAVPAARPGGRGLRAAAAPSSAALVARRAGAATAADAVQRNERWGWSVSALGAGEWVGTEGGRRAERGLWWLLLALFSGSTVSPGLSRHRERRDQRPSAGGGGATAGKRRRWQQRRGGGGRPRRGKMASAHAPRRRRHKAGSGGEGGGGSSDLAERWHSRRKLPKASGGAEARGSGGGESLRGSESGSR